MDVIPVEGAMLDRVLDAFPPTWRDGLDRRAYGQLCAAQSRTAWGRTSLQRFALVDGEDLLASAELYDLGGNLDGRPVRICGIGRMAANPAHPGHEPARVLIGTLLDRAAARGAELALMFAHAGRPLTLPTVFAPIPFPELTLRVSESPRYGAPMTMVRGGEDRDLAAIVAMGRVRARSHRFHLDRDIDLVQHAIIGKRLLAGLGSPGARQLHFFIAEEGTTAAAYVVLSVSGDTWMLEECGDRDSSGARVGALLQALIAREPVGRRPTIRAWLPSGFLPPQITIVSTAPSAATMMVGRLGDTPSRPALTGGDILYWPNDVFGASGSGPGDGG